MTDVPAIERAVEVLEELTEVPNAEVPVVRFVRRMVDNGFTPDRAIELVNDLIDRGRIRLTDRYNLVLPA